MERKELTAHDLQRLSGVPAPTVYRFLTGRHSEPKSETIRKWAHALGVTEGQLRGTEPIDGVSTLDRSQSLKDLLTPDEFILVSNVKNMDKDSRGILYKMAEKLVEIQESSKQITSSEKQKSDIETNTQLCIGENYYPSPPKKRRLKDYSDGRKSTRASKFSKVA